MVLAWARTIKVLEGIGLKNREQKDFALHLDALYNRIDKSWIVVIFVIGRSRFAGTIPDQLSPGQLRLILIG
jgi:hypothetical protein